MSKATGNAANIIIVFPRLIFSSCCLSSVALQITFHSTGGEYEQRNKANVWLSVTSALPLRGPVHVWRHWAVERRRSIPAGSWGGWRQEPENKTRVLKQARYMNEQQAPWRLGEGWTAKWYRPVSTYHHLQGLLRSHPRVVSCHLSQRLLQGLDQQDHWAQHGKYAKQQAAVEP